MEKLVPITREETFMAAAAGDTTEKLTPITRKEKFLARIAENAGGGTGGGTGGSSAFNDIVAKVGQTFRVKEVDANGKVTAVEAADYQKRICDDVFIFPETTLTSDSAHFDLPELAIVEGKEYTVKYNGTEYICTCGKWTDVLYLGDMSAPTSGECPATGEPFYIALFATDGSRILQALDGSKEVTLSIEAEAEKIPTKYVPTLEEMRTKTEVILPEVTMEIADPEMPMGLIPQDISLEVGKTYKVNYNGVEYEVSNGLKVGDEEFAIGNLSLLDPDGELPTVDVPFCITRTYLGDDAESQPIYGWACFALDGSTEVTLSIAKEVVVPIQPKFLPTYDIKLNLDQFDTVNNNYRAILTKCPFELLEAMYTGKLIYINVVYEIGGSVTRCVGMASYNVADELDIHLEVIKNASEEELAFLLGSLGVRLHARLSYELDKAADFFIRFAPAN